MTEAVFRHEENLVCPLIKRFFFVSDSGNATRVLRKPSRLFQQADPAGAYLYVVGSIRVPEPEVLRYRDEMVEQWKASPGRVRLIEQFVDDRRFDMWLKAADVVILPYLEICSSSVGARAGVLGARLWIRSQPNLLGQFAGREVVVFRDFDHLRELFACFA